MKKNTKAEARGYRDESNSCRSNRSTESKFSVEPECQIDLVFKAT